MDPRNRNPRAQHDPSPQDMIKAIDAFDDKLLTHVCTTLINVRGTLYCTECGEPNGKSPR
jgi:hypothetical protein